MKKDSKKEDKKSKKTKEKKRKIPFKKLSIGISGSLLGLGGALFLLNKKNKTEKETEVPIKIDESKKWIFVQTEKYSEPIDGELRTCYLEYVLEKTNFLLVNILSQGENLLPIYYVTPYRIVEVGEGQIKAAGDSFYAVVGIPGEKGKRDKLGFIQKGKRIVFHLCIVGGGKNGIATGDKLYSKRVVTNVEFE